MKKKQQQSIAVSYPKNGITAVVDLDAQIEFFAIIDHSDVTTRHCAEKERPRRGNFTPTSITEEVKDHVDNKQVRNCLTTLYMTTKK